MQKSQEQSNSETLKPYSQKAIPTVIKFTSRASVKIVDRNKQDHYYTIEYGEERQIQNFDNTNLDKERQILIDDCNTIVDAQLKDIVDMYIPQNL